MTKIFFYDFGSREEIIVVTEVEQTYINNIKLHEKIVIGSIRYDVNDIKYNFDEDTIRFGLVREGIER